MENIGPKDLVNLVGLLLAIAAQTWGLVQFMLKRIEDQRKDFESRMHRVEDEYDKEVEQLHLRVNQVRDEYVKRQELDRELEALTRNLADLKVDFHRSMENISGQNNHIIAILSRRPD